MFRCLKSYYLVFNQDGIGMSQSVVFVQIEWLKGHDSESPGRHQPLLAISVLLAATRHLNLTDHKQSDLLIHMDRYLASCGVCERIIRTPIPMPYSRCVIPASAPLFPGTDPPSLDKMPAVTLCSI
jgi:hypothetical protein